MHNAPANDVKLSGYFAVLLDLYSANPSIPD